LLPSICGAKRLYRRVVVSPILVDSILDEQQIRPVVRHGNHFSSLNLRYDFVLTLIESDEEHVHVFQRRALLVELRLEDGVVHEVDACHSTHDNVG
jgi:hypothetical protein